jgi:hypothetical protein
MRRRVGTKKFAVAIGLMLLVMAGLPQILTAQQAQEFAKGYLDYLDAYYKDGNVSDLNSAKNSIKSELDASLALKIQSYYYNAEIEYLLAYEKLSNDPFNQEKVNNLKNLLIELYHRYLDSYYQFKGEGVEKTSLEGNTAYLFKDVFLAATVMPSANSVSPIVKNLLRRANKEDLYNKENSFVASVNDIFKYEEPNLFGMANMIRAVWSYDKYMQIEENSPTRDSIRETVTYHAAIALDTLRSDFGQSIASFLLATTNSNRSNDAAWNYFKKCLEWSSDDSEFPQTGFYAKNYNREIYLANAVAFLPAFCEYLYDNGRYTEIIETTEYLVDLGDLDQGMMENVSKEAIFWGEKALRALQEHERFADADDMYRRLHAFYKFLQLEKTFSDQPEE